jgi:hypothetical protein
MEVALTLVKKINHWLIDALKQMKKSSDQLIKAP